MHFLSFLALPLPAAASDYPVCQGYAMQQPCDLGVGSEVFGPGKLVIGLPPNSSLTAALRGAMLVLEDNGKLSEAKRTW